MEENSSAARLGEPLLALCFDIARVLGDSFWFCTYYGDTYLLKSIAALAPRRRPRAYNATRGPI